MKTLYIDIETAPQHWWKHRDFEVNPPAVAMNAVLQEILKGPPKNYSKPASIQRWHRQQQATVPGRAVKWWRDCSLSPERGMVVVAGYAIDDGAPQTLCQQGLHEQDLLDDLLYLLCDVRPSRIVAFNGDDFDFPFLWRRAMYWRKVELARWFAQPHYSDQVKLQIQPLAALVDPRRIWTQGYRYEPGKLDELVNAIHGLHVHRDPDDIDGSAVLDALCAGQIDAVTRHASTDVEVLRTFWRDVVGPSIGAEMGG